MSIFSDNIRFLRTQKNLSQQELADQILMSRVRYSKYEDGRSEAPYELLIRISKYFNLSIDLLLTVDIRKYPLEDVLKLPDNRIVLPVVVDQLGNNSIEIVPQKASMGYLSGYSDPEYIESLQRISLPFLTNGKYRAFPAQGDSMPPFKDGSYIIGKYVENIDDLKPNKSYVFVTLNDGISYKRFKAKKEKSITVAADNSFYQPYDISLSEIVEIWQYASGIFPNDFEPDNFENYNLKDMFLVLRKDIELLNDKLSKN
ncbi:XRE family transcriptional regulator [Chryseobacterium gambrini]|jgi:transcriptional regulator with XRE-family HTH domain|uniref:Helix-turn-helix domain-containing protein n=1 Tax=Chryseobacterium gambrini TaxID=373672 RepID=A0A1N7MKW1_9FLAO|nr:LexA family transcriptional regulator [Chryseobacterium gambrini]MDN4029819.1 LexA family transcriptional regulator [Chryseobacterium gambrini]SIS86786.1 Helix-turn-helix domain-containing protein [Chryseobacterium gambrini]HAO08427.1 helix-turn-helix domain-containing protein [Chryseobacterium sp.]